MAAHAVRFADLVEMVDRLPLDQRESLIDVVRKRIAEEGRRRIVASVRSAKREHLRGRCKPTAPDDLMKEILA